MGLPGRVDYYEPVIGQTAEVHFGAILGHVNQTLQWTLRLGAAADEWELGDASKFESFTNRHAGGPWQTTDVSTAQSNSHCVVIPPFGVTASPDGKVEVHIRHRETKRLNDQMFGQFAFCTQNPRVTLSASPPLECDVAFWTSSAAVRWKGPWWGLSRLAGTLLPEQPINVAQGGLRRPRGSQ
jgi:hypothetical protein